MLDDDDDFDRDTLPWRVEMQCGEPVVIVDADGPEARAAEADQDWCAERIAEAGFGWTGRGSNDPYGTWGSRSNFRY